MARSATATSAPPGPQGPAILAPVAGLWQRISPSLVPVLAVLTALIATIPFMVVTGGQGDVGRGLNIAFTAYAAFIEGSVGVAINEMLDVDDVSLVQQYAEEVPLNPRNLRALSADVSRVVATGPETLEAYNDTINRYSDTLDDAAIDELAERIPAMVAIGADDLRAMLPLIDGLSELDNADANALIDQYAGLEEITSDDQAALAATVPAAADYDPIALMDYFQTMEDQGTIVTMRRIAEQFRVLEELGISPVSTDAQDFVAIAGFASPSQPGAAIVRELVAVNNTLTASGIEDKTTFAAQLNLVNQLYAEDVLTNEDVTVALNMEFQPYLDANFVVYRPGVQAVLIVEGETGTSGVLYDDQNTPDDLTDDEPEVVYVQLGDRAFLFFPFVLERTLVRSIPFIIAGLAVALGFKAGLFNIGAEGQLYAGGILAVWLGFSDALTTLTVTFSAVSLFAGIGIIYYALRRLRDDGPRQIVIVAGIAVTVVGLVLSGTVAGALVTTETVLPALARIPIVLLAGIVGGGIWGMIPGLLKAYTGAHEVINTIMLNFIAIRLTDWLIRSKDPYILRDPDASVDQTPNVLPEAVLPRFNEVPEIWFFIGGLIVFGLLVWPRRQALLSGQLQTAIRPLMLGALTVAGGFVLAWLTVRNSMHLGFVIMIASVWLTNWFLERTTPGFELRTVGANPDAAKYAGMSVKWNIVLALTLSGALAGLAGAIELGSVQFNMKPGFFSGLGFDAIAVALLARTNPRNMIWAGLLWGALVSAQGLVGVRASISADLTRIIQALIIMFIAADAIVRWLWRVPEASEDEKVTTFSKGWGG